jgi:cytochrome b pre-mRNA-processing protein 3
MIFGLFRRKKDEETISSLYGAIVAQARSPVFYRDLGVADTAEGRFEMMVLHVFMVLHRLKEEGEERRQLGQSLFNVLFLDLDRGLRELGVGDLKVPKKIRKMGESFYGRVKAYDEALASPDNRALEQALARNVLGKLDAPAGAFASYVRACVVELSALPFERLAAGDVQFPAVPRGAGS